jgi:hypothetical protein
MFISKDHARAVYIENHKKYEDERPKYITPETIAKIRKEKTEKMKAYRLRNPLKNKARKAVYINLRNGKLQKQPCEKCGDLKVEAHHEDYNQPLKVIWVCKIHHVELDKLLKNVVKPLKND